MNPVCYNLDGGESMGWGCRRDAQQWINAVLAGRKDFPCGFLVVHYDNGQTVTFKHKPTMGRVEEW